MSDNCGVIYMLRGDSHAARLLVSIVSLTRYWGSGITIVCTDSDAMPVGKNIADYCGVSFKEYPLDKADKTLVGDFTPYDKTVFLDCDTLVVGDITSLFPVSNEMVLTTFGGWVTTGSIIGGRCRKWSDVAPREVERSQSMSWPALNAGVFGFCSDTLFMRDWNSFTARNLSLMSDEISAQLMFPDYPVRLVDDRYNHHVKNGNSKGKDDVRIHNFQGNNHLTHRGNKIWLPEFQELYDNNSAGIRDWCPAGDKKLRRHLAE